MNHSSLVLTSQFNQLQLTAPHNCLSQMIYYVDNLTDTIKFYHSLLKDNGRLMIIVEMSK